MTSDELKMVFTWHAEAAEPKVVSEMLAEAQSSLAAADHPED